MVVRYDDLLSLITTLGEEEGIRVSVKGSIKGTLIVTAICLVFSLLLGPIGLAIGGSFGGIAAWLQSRDKFRPLATVIRNDLTQEQREELTQKVRSVVGDLEASDAMELVALVMLAEAIPTFRAC